MKNTNYIEVDNKLRELVRKELSDNAISLYIDEQVLNGCLKKVSLESVRELRPGLINNLDKIDKKGRFDLLRTSLAIIGGKSSDTLENKRFKDAVAGYFAGTSNSFMDEKSSTKSELGAEFKIRTQYNQVFDSVLNEIDGIVSIQNLAYSLFDGLDYLALVIDSKVNKTGVGYKFVDKFSDLIEYYSSLKELEEIVRFNDQLLTKLESLSDGGIYEIKLSEAEAQVISKYVEKYDKRDMRFRESRVQSVISGNDGFKKKIEVVCADFSNQLSIETKKFLNSWRDLQNFILKLALFNENMDTTGLDKIIVYGSFKGENDTFDLAKNSKVHKLSKKIIKKGLS